MESVTILVEVKSQGLFKWGLKSKWFPAAENHLLVLTQPVTEGGCGLKKLGQAESL